MSLFVKGDLHGNIIEALSYNHNPDLRQLTADDVLVVCGDIGLGWTGADKTYKYILDFLAAKPYQIVFVRGNHDHIGVIRNCSKPTEGNGRTVELIGGTFSNPVYNDKVYENVYWVSDSAIVRICGHKSLLISGASSHDVWNLVMPYEKERKRHLRRNHQFFREVGISWWSDEGINIPYLYSLLKYYCNIQEWQLWNNKDEWIGDFEFIFSHDCPGEMCSLYARDVYRMKPTVNEIVLERLRTHLNYRFWVHGHMHTFRHYGIEEHEDGRTKSCVCLYKEIFKLPDESDNIQDWKFICTCDQLV